MTSTTSCLRLLAVATLLTGAVLMTGCAGPDKVVRTTTTERTTTIPPPPVTTSTTTTTTEQVRP